MLRRLAPPSLHHFRKFSWCFRQNDTNTGHTSLCGRYSQEVSVGSIAPVNLAISSEAISGYLIPPITRSVSNFTKKVTYQAAGKDQLSNMIGQAQPGDKVKLHIEGSFMEYDKPRFTVGKKAFFKRKQVLTQFLDTSIAGETAHLEVVIPKYVQSQTTLPAILADAVRTMTLGESATITFTTSKDQGITERIHRAHHADVPPDTMVVLDASIFRIVRDGKEHRRPARNGTSGAAIGGRMF